ncbi:MAG: hypothetical protein ACLVKO_09085 [Dysgonomonas sp.]
MKQDRHKTEQRIREIEELLVSDISATTFSRLNSERNSLIIKLENTERKENGEKDEPLHAYTYRFAGQKTQNYQD